jgi:hypothetical protein
MPKYVYGCTHKNHPRVEVEHSINYSYLERCAVCGGILHRIPQRFQFGVSPLSLIQAWDERNWAKKLRGEPREKSYDSVRTDVGKPQKDFYSRK